MIARRNYEKIFLVNTYFAICLTGCTNKEGVIECNLSSNDVVNGYKINSTYKISYNGNFVTSVETEEIVISNNDELLNNFESKLNDSYEKANTAYGGYTYNVIKEDGKVISKVNIDYSKMDIEQFAKDQPSLKSYSKDNKLLTEGVQKIYESIGATCK